MDIYKNVIVADDQVELTRNIIVTVDPVGGYGFLGTGLSVDGNLPITFWITSGYLTEETVAMMMSAEEMYTQAQDADMTDVTLAQCEAIMATADVTDDQPFIALARLGLQLYVPPEDMKKGEETA
jgi:hypothetical protein